MVRLCPFRLVFASRLCFPLANLALCNPSLAWPHPGTYLGCEQDGTSIRRPAPLVLAGVANGSEVSRGVRWDCEAFGRHLYIEGEADVTVAGLTFFGGSVNFEGGLGGFFFLECVRIATIVLPGLKSHTLVAQFTDPQSPAVDRFTLPVARFHSQRERGLKETLRQATRPQGVCSRCVAR